MSTRIASRRRRVGALGAVIGAAALVVAGTSLLAFGSGSGDLQTTVASVFDGGCTTPDQAESSLSRELEANGYVEWTVESRASSGDCVTAGVIESSRTIVLLPVDGPNVASTMDGVASELRRDCLNEAAARTLAGQALSGAGVLNFEIRTDGPLAYPSGEADAVMQHLDDGCFVYTGSGRSAEGTPVYYIYGNKSS